MCAMHGLLLQECMGRSSELPGVSLGRGSTSSKVHEAGSGCDSYDASQAALELAHILLRFCGINLARLCSSASWLTASAARAFNNSSNSTLTSAPSFATLQTALDRPCNMDADCLRLRTAYDFCLKHPCNAPAVIKHQSHKPCARIMWQFGTQKDDTCNNEQEMRPYLWRKVSQLPCDTSENGCTPSQGTMNSSIIITSACTTGQVAIHVLTHCSTRP